MPVATIALFAMAVVVIAIAFLIQQLVSDNGGNNLSVTDTFATTQARRLTATAQAGGGQQTAPPGGQTQQPGGQTPGQTAQPGQSVTPGTGTPATRTGTPGTGTPSSGKTYTVQAGDTCGKIAADNNITLQQLMQVNNITDPNCPINVGDVLKLP
jgi:LysM repeat protein